MLALPWPLILSLTTERFTSLLYRAHQDLLDCCIIPCQNSGTPPVLPRVCTLLSLQLVVASNGQFVVIDWSTNQHYVSQFVEKEHAKLSISNTNNLCTCCISVYLPPKGSVKLMPGFLCTLSLITSHYYVRSTKCWHKCKQQVSPTLPPPICACVGICYQKRSCVVPVFVHPYKTNVGRKNAKFSLSMLCVVG